MRNVMTVLHSWLITCGLSRQGGSPIVEARSGLIRRRRGAPSGEQSPEAAAQDRRPRSENRDLGVTHTSCDLHYGRVQGSLKDRKSTRLNSSHVSISYAVFCLKKKGRRHR